MAVKELLSGSIKSDGFDFDIDVVRYGEAQYGSYIEIEETIEPGHTFHIHIMSNYWYANSPQLALRKSWREVSDVLKRVQKALDKCVRESLDKLSEAR